MLVFFNDAVYSALNMRTPLPIRTGRLGCVFYSDLPLGFLGGVPTTSQSKEVEHVQFSQFEHVAFLLASRRTLAEEYRTAF